ECDVKVDQNLLGQCLVPQNRLLKVEKEEILTVVNLDLPRIQIVLKWRTNLHTNRRTTMCDGKKRCNITKGSHKPSNRILTVHLAKQANQVRTWDITWLI